MLKNPKVSQITAKWKQVTLEKINKNTWEEVVLSHNKNCSRVLIIHHLLNTKENQNLNIASCNNSSSVSHCMGGKVYMSSGERR